MNFTQQLKLILRGDLLIELDQLFQVFSNPHDSFMEGLRRVDISVPANSLPGVTLVLGVSEDKVLSE